MKKNINLVIDGIAPEKVMYDTDNHSLVVLYPAQREFKKGDKVRLKKNLDLMPGYNYGNTKYTTAMDDIKDAILTVERISNSTGSLATTNNINNDWWWYKPEWLEHIVEDEVKFKRGDILASDDVLLIFDEYEMFNQEKDLFHSIWTNWGVAYNKNWTTKYFKHATDKQIAQLHEDLREEGKKWNAETLQVEDLDISDIVVDWITACEYLNKPMPKNYVYEPNSDFEKQINAQIELQMICRAWNKADVFVVDLAYSGQCRYYPIINLSTGNIEDGVGRVSASIDSSCYCFKSIERAKQFGTQFKDLLETAMGL